MSQHLRKMKFFDAPISIGRCSFAICTLEHILKLLPYFLRQSENKLGILRKVPKANSLERKEN